MCECVKYSYVPLLFCVFARAPSSGDAYRYTSLKRTVGTTGPVVVSSRRACLTRSRLLKKSLYGRGPDTGRTGRERYDNERARRNRRRVTRKCALFVHVNELAHGLTDTPHPQWAARRQNTATLSAVRKCSATSRGGRGRTVGRMGAPRAATRRLRWRLRKASRR